MGKAFEVEVRGRVQRTGFRRYVLELAQELGLSGSVENRPNGSVHIFLQGEEEPIKRLIDRLKEAPIAKVEKVKVSESKPKPELKHFKIIYGPLEEELQEGFGAMQNTFMAYWGEFREFRDEFREFAKRTDENFKLTFEKYGEISNKLTTILETLVKESSETREKLTKALNLLTKLVEKLLEK
ncbi:MAG: acylphosphatase [Candidatus Bathyarchaeia archaeon]